MGKIVSLLICVACLGCTATAATHQACSSLAAAVLTPTPHLDKPQTSDENYITIAQYGLYHITIVDDYKGRTTQMVKLESGDEDSPNAMWGQNCDGIDECDAICIKTMPDPVGYYDCNPEATAAAAARTRLNTVVMLFDEHAAEEKQRRDRRNFELPETPQGE